MNWFSGTVSRGMILSYESALDRRARMELVYKSLERDGEQS